MVQLMNNAQRHGACALMLLSLVVAGCGLGNRSNGSIFGHDSNSNDQCSYDNARYAEGSAICRSGRQVRCNAGRWKDLGENCGKADSTASCTFNGNTYASGKASCQSGKRYRCQDGAWSNTGNSCKDLS